MSDTIITSRLEGTRLVVETDRSTESYDSQFLVAALLIFVARGSGQIQAEVSSRMLDLIQWHFQLEGAQSLELLTRAMSELAEKPELPDLLSQLGETLSEQDKEDIALMALKVIAADGRREAAEMEQFNQAVASVDISPESVHRAFDRYFAETLPGI